MTTATTPYIGIPLRGRVSGFRRFSVAEYHRLIDIGMLTENDDLELLDGHLVKKISKGPVHDGTLSKVEKRVVKIIPLGWDTRNQSVLTLTGSEPEPDLHVARVDADDYMTRHPTVADVGLVIDYLPGQNIPLVLDGQTVAELPVADLLP